MSIQKKSAHLWVINNNTDCHFLNPLTSAYTGIICMPLQWHFPAGLTGYPLIFRLQWSLCWIFSQDRPKISIFTLTQSHQSSVPGSLNLHFHTSLEPFYIFFVVKIKKGKGRYSSSWHSISKLRDVTCHMGSPSVTCHPTQVNVPRLTPAMQAGTRFTYPSGMEGWVDLGDLIVPRPGVEPATFRSACPNHCNLYSS